MSKTNPRLDSLIADLKATARDGGSDVWADIADRHRIGPIGGRELRQREHDRVVLARRGDERDFDAHDPPFALGRKRTHPLNVADAFLAIEGLLNAEFGIGTRFGVEQRSEDAFGLPNYAE